MTQAPTRVIVWALALQAVLAASCDRGDEGKAAAPPPQPTSAPVTGAAALVTGRAGVLSEEFLLKLAALRQLIADQPRAADRAAYAAYLLRDPDALKLAELLTSSSAGTGDGPPVVASVDSYKRKGRTIDAATGKPVKVLQVRIVRPAGGDPGEGPTADVVASWQAGKLAGASFRYRLRKEARGWAVVGRAEEGP